MQLFFFVKYWSHSFLWYFKRIKINKKEAVHDARLIQGFYQPCQEWHGLNGGWKTQHPYFLPPTQAVFYSHYFSNRPKPTER